MKQNKKRERKTMRIKNRNRINRLRNEQQIVLPLMMPIFILVLLKLNLEAITTPLKMAERLLLHVSKLTGNANFTLVPGYLTDLQALAEDLSDTIVLIEGGDLTKIPHRDTLMLQAENAIRQMSYLVQQQSAGDAEKIKSAGFDVRKGKGASQEVGEVTKLRSKTSTGGKVKLLYARVPHSKMNYIEVTDNPVTGTWTPVGKTTRASYEITGLIPGRVYYFRVYGSNNLGDGPPSAPAEQRSM